MSDENSTNDLVEATVIDAVGNVISIITVLQSEVDAREDIVPGVAPDPLENKRVWWNGTAFEQIDITISPDLAEWNDIKNYRDQFADTPVFIVEHGLLDVDSASMEMLQMAEDHFVFLPTVEEGKLAWKMADNTIVYLTHAELIAMNAEAKDLRAKQVAIMFYRAEVFRAMDPAPTLEYVASYNNWIEP